TAGQGATFSASASSDGDGYITTYTWSFDGVAQAPRTGPSIDFTFATAGQHTVALTVTDNASGTHTVSHTIAVASAGTLLRGPAPNFSGSGWSTSALNVLSSTRINWWSWDGSITRSFTGQPNSN